MLRHLGQTLRGARRLAVAFEESSSGYLPARSLSNSTAACTSDETDTSSYDWFYDLPTWWSHQKPSADKYCRQRQVLPLGNLVPWLASDVYVAPSAVVLGDVDIFDGVTIWHGAVVRGDLNNIRIGAMSSINENCVIHAARTSPSGLTAATIIGRYVTIGAGSIVRSCIIEDKVVIGERSVLMEGSVVSSHSVLLPGTVLPPAKFIPAGQLWGGNPANFVRNLTHDEEIEIAQLADATEKYRDLHVAEELPVGNEWRTAEAVDPVADRLNPSTENTPEWVYRARA